VLLELDRTTGSGTFIGRIGTGFDLVKALAWHSGTKKLYGLESQVDNTDPNNPIELPDRLITIDTTTGVGTVAGSQLTPVIITLGGLSYRPANDSLVTIAQGQYYEIDVGTGTATPKWQIPRAIFNTTIDPTSGQLFGTVNIEAELRRDIVELDLTTGNQTTVVPQSASYFGMLVIP